jgi:hypothetical protein
MDLGGTAIDAPDLDDPLGVVVDREPRVVAEGVPAFGVGQRAVETSPRRP